MSMSAMDGMSSMGMSGQNGAMTAYLHFTPFLDTLLFQYWVPTSPAAVLAACIGLFLLSIFERWIAACKAVAEKSWSESARLEARLRQSKQIPEKSPEHSNRESKSSQSSSLKPLMQSKTTTPRPNVFKNLAPPFIPSQDISRGILHATQTALSYLFMLASMTFQAAFIISMCLGAGVGEMMFGRYMSGSSSHH